MVATDLYHPVLIDLERKLRRVETYLREHFVGKNDVLKPLRIGISERIPKDVGRVARFDRVMLYLEVKNDVLIYLLVLQWSAPDNSVCYGLCRGFDHWLAMEWSLVSPVRVDVRFATLELLRLRYSGYWRNMHRSMSPVCIFKGSTSHHQTLFCSPNNSKSQLADSSDLLYCPP